MQSMTKLLAVEYPLQRSISQIDAIHNLWTQLLLSCYMFNQRVSVSIQYGEYFSAEMGAGEVAMLAFWESSL
jgi:hypothetical protein